jgi:hypothetical protein
MPSFTAASENGGIDIADNKNEIRAVFKQDGFDTLENCRGLRRVGAGADFEIHVGPGDTHLAEENVGQGFVVVLAGMDEDRLDLRMALHLADERGNLGEIGPCAYDVDDFQLGAHEAHELVKCFKGQQYSI